ncbi:phospholipase A2, membrane associated [Saccopteryx bilineata]|uniref:phospholipase A2, membrane associated n=1 Tax=Saccopteryx bilineata TaxID=59482 RepID=UPI00338F1B51
MKILLLLALTLAFGLLQTHGDLLDFWKMIRLMTGKKAVSSYAFYGCYCGFRGRGFPKDSTDWCCARHDCCYTLLEKQGCGTMFAGYEFTYQNGQIICAKQDRCKSELCLCDKTAAICFAENLNTYNKSYQYYNNWGCGSRKAMC